MNWKDIAGKVGQFAPMLGAILGGPVGAAVTVAGSIASVALGVDNTPDAVAKALAIDPQAAVKLAQIEADKYVALESLATEVARAELAAATQNASDINATMQAEARSEHWVQFAWRPSIGFAVAFAIALSVLTVFAAYGAALFAERVEGLQHLPGILAAIMGIIGVASPILGIASWFRGKKQVNESGP